MALNFSNTKGDTFNEVPFQIKINDVSVDLTGAIIKMQLKTKAIDTCAALTLISTANAGLTITGALSGLFKINEQIIDIPVFNYLYDIQITFSDGTVKTWIKGNFNITPEITI